MIGPGSDKNELKKDRVKMGETKKNPLFVTPQPAVVKRPLSCQSVITFCNFAFHPKWKKNLIEKLTKYLVEEVVTTTFIQVVAQNKK